MIASQIATRNSIPKSLCQLFGIPLYNYRVGVLMQRLEERLRHKEREGENVLDECQWCLPCTTDFLFLCYSERDYQRIQVSPEGVTHRCKLVF